MTFSCGMREAVSPLPALLLLLLLSCPVCRNQALLVVSLVFFSGHTWAGELSLTESSIASPLPGCHASAQEHKPLDIRLEHSGSFSPFHFSSFLATAFSSLNHSTAISVFLSRSASFPRSDSLPTPPALSLSLETGWLCVSSQEPVQRVVQTTGKMFHFFFFFFLYSIRVTHLCTSPLECVIAGVHWTELAGGFPPPPPHGWRGSYVLLKAAHWPSRGSMWLCRATVSNFPISHHTKSNFSEFVQRRDWYPCQTSLLYCFSLI